jgi:hypothetical protein
MSDTNERSVASTGSTAWISVSDRLPPEDVEVFVAAFTPSKVPLFYSSAKWRMTPRGSLAWQDEDCVINHPTHWMPIPPPPGKSDQP